MAAPHHRHSCFLSSPRELAPAAREQGSSVRDPNVMQSTVLQSSSRDVWVYPWQVVEGPAEFAEKHRLRIAEHFRVQKKASHHKQMWQRDIQKIPQDRDDALARYHFWAMERIEAKFPPWSDSRPVVSTAQPGTRFSYVSQGSMPPAPRPHVVGAVHLMAPPWE